MKGPEKRTERGFTLIELLVTVSVMGIMGALAMSSFSSWATAAEHRAARDETVSTLRNAAERSLSEGRIHCVHFEGAQWTTYRFACPPDTGVLVAGPTPLDSDSVTLVPAVPAAPGLEDSCPTPGTCAYFYPRGNASPGNVSVKREGRSSYTVTIVGLTSRVFES